MLKQIILVILIIGLIISNAGCSKRIALKSYEAPSTIPGSITILVPVDLRDQHYGEPVANSEWKSCKTVYFREDQMSGIIQSRLIEEFNSSNLFSSVQKPEANPEIYVLRPEVHVFCGQKKGLFC